MSDSGSSQRTTTNTAAAHETPRSSNKTKEPSFKNRNGAENVKTSYHFICLTIENTINTDYKRTLLN